MSRLLRYLVVALVLFGIGYVCFWPGGAPAIELTADRPGVGRGGTTLRVRAVAPRGVSAIRVEARQEDQVVTVAEARFPGPSPLAFWAHGEREATLEAELGPESFSGLVEGTLGLRVSAAGARALLLGPRTSIEERALPVDLRPPTIGVASRQNYVSQGGSGLVVYRVSEDALAEGGRDGVQAGGWFFPGQALEGGAAGERYALYGVPYDLSEASEIRLLAEDPLGNTASVAFLDRFFPHPLRTDTIHLTVGFMEKVVPEILAQTPQLADQGDLLENYLAINGELRAANSKRLKELGQQSWERFLWKGAFLQLPGSQVTSSFADRRTYVFEGKDVDRQDHLGFDLASVSGAPVPAANRGIVVLAHYFGIYGNTVVLDHGVGLMTLYSHLSSIEVTEGQEVEKGETIGHTGQTGLAGGDHLHFTTMIHGLPVTPIEWWDPAWIRDRVLAKLEAATSPSP